MPCYLPPANKHCECEPGTPFHPRPSGGGSLACIKFDVPAPTWRATLNLHTNAPVPHTGTRIPFVHTILDTTRPSAMPSATANPAHRSTPVNPYVGCSPACTKFDIAAPTRHATRMCTPTIGAAHRGRTCHSFTLHQTPPAQMPSYLPTSTGNASLARRSAPSFPGLLAGTHTVQHTGSDVARGPRGGGVPQNHRPPGPEPQPRSLCPPRTCHAQKVRKMLPASRKARTAKEK